MVDRLHVLDGPRHVQGRRHSGLAPPLGVFEAVDRLVGRRWVPRLLALCAPLSPASGAPPLRPDMAAFTTGIRPKWYPTIEHRRATTFTPKELDEWNQGKVGPHAEIKTSR